MPGIAHQTPVVLRHQAVERQRDAGDSRLAQALGQGSADRVLGGQHRLQTRGDRVAEHLRKVWPEQRLAPGHHQGPGAELGGLGKELGQPPARDGGVGGGRSRHRLRVAVGAGARTEPRDPPLQGPGAGQEAAAVGRRRRPDRVEVVGVQVERSRPAIDQEPVEAGQQAFDHQLGSLLTRRLENAGDPCEISPPVHQHQHRGLAPRESGDRHAVASAHDSRPACTQGQLPGGSQSRPHAPSARVQKGSGA